MTKKCNKCLTEQDIDNFIVRTDNNKKRNECESCLKKIQLEYRKKNRDKARKTTKAWREANLVRSRANVRRWRKENIEYARAKEIEYKKNRLKTDPAYKIACLLRTRILQILDGVPKSGHTIELIGCKPQELKKYLESKFRPGMNWDNHGFGDDKWHIDHIKPCNSFNLLNPEEQKACFNYKNLQPLWQHENLSKGSNYDQ
jgi:hypothetical protein